MDKGRNVQGYLATSDTDDIISLKLSRISPPWHQLMRTRAFFLGLYGSQFETFQLRLTFNVRALMPASSARSSSATAGEQEETK